MNDLAACLPASVTLLAPHLVSGQPDGTYDSYVITLTSLALPEFSSVSGFPGTKVLRTTATDTSATIQALAVALATDWYQWQRARHDVRLAGCQGWQPDGLTDVIEWLDTADECSTRARRGVWADLADTLYHQGAVGSGSTTIDPAGPTTHPAPQTYPGPVTYTGPQTFTSSVTITNGPTNIGGTTTLTGPTNISSGPLTLPPKPGSPPTTPGAIYYDAVNNQIVFVGPGPSYSFVVLAAGGAVAVQNTDGTQVTSPVSLIKCNNDLATGLLKWVNQGGGAGYASWMGLQLYKSGFGQVGPETVLEVDDDGGSTGVIATIADHPADGRVYLKYSWKGLTLRVGGTNYGPEPALEVIAGSGITLTGADDAVNKRDQLTIAASGTSGAGNAWGYHYCGSGPNRRYFAGVAVNTSAPSSNPFANGTLYAVPFVFGGGGSSIARAGVKINTAASGSHFRCGVYTNTSSTFPYPNSLIAETGELLGSVSGVQEGPVGAAISAGNLYWITFLCDSVALFINTYVGSAQGMWNILGADTSYSGIAPLGWKVVAFGYGAMPGGFPAGGALAVTGSSTDSIPQLGLEVD